ncbi:hypothetical protein E8E15_009399 [Penicillium rubens]|nr:hypothetical protein E8E15_009399 [Penicillium rubens]
MPSVTSIEGDVRKGSAPLTIVLDSDPSSSLLWRDLRTESSIDRSRMLLSGKFEELKKSLNTDELRAITTWFHQFWLFSYKTAKYWGRGPRLWTPDLLSFEPFQQPEFELSPKSPHTNIKDMLPCAKNVKSALAYDTTRTLNKGCSLIMHLDPESFGKKALGSSSPSRQGSSIIEPVKEDANIFQEETLLVDSMPVSQGLDDLVMQQNESYSDSDPQIHANPLAESWTPWPESWIEASFKDTLQTALETNGFSTVPLEDLPFSVPEVLGSTDHSLFADSLSFAIMAGNDRLVYNLLESGEMQQADISGLFPFHLAATYLDGTKVCCQIFHTLVCVMGPQYLNQLYVNNLGHTVLDCLMISVLKSHTTSYPRDVDTAWAREGLFPGAEVDLCGRWDADSEIVRELLKDKQGDVAYHSKHHFCHTSVQTICHCIRGLFALKWSPDINHSSGLFLRRCAACGLSMHMRPLHTLVLTAAHLIYNGCQGEDLFGIVACALCLLSHGADPGLKSAISIATLLGQSPTTVCSHEDLTPATLAHRLTPEFERKWTKASKVGWEILCLILDNNLNGTEDDLSQLGPMSHAFGIDCATDGRHKRPFDMNQNIATLWAIIQVEFLTYRCRHEGDACHSEDFNMHAVLESLKVGGTISSGHLKKRLLKPFCRCGRFSQDSWRNEKIDDALAGSAGGNKDDLKEVYYISDELDFYFV